MRINERVRSILKYVPKTRNSDKELLVVYMQKAGMDLDERQIRVFKSLPSMETIRRIRQKIQEGGEFRADKPVENARYEKFKDMKDAIARSNSDERTAEEIAESQGYKLVD